MLFSLISLIMSGAAFWYYHREERNVEFKRVMLIISCIYIGMAFGFLGTSLTVG